MNQGDVFTFLAADNRYKVIICTSIYKARSPHYCIFAALTYDNEEIPVIEDAINSGFWGKAVYRAVILNIRTLKFNVCGNIIPKLSLII